MEPLISVQNLSKHFKIRTHHQGRFSSIKNFFTQDFDLIKAVDKISFSINAGELVGYIGPNGAGKSTTLKMLTGLLVPSAGHLDIMGYLPWKQRQQYVSNIGAVFGQRTTLWWDLPVIESLELIQHIYKIPEAQYSRNLDNFRQLLQLDSFINSPVRTLSLGQRMRADICAALLHNPKIVFLDEPTIGLDVVAKEHIRNFIQHINTHSGTTIILTTHDLSDIEKLCERIIIIDAGRILFDGRLDHLRERFGGERQLIVDFAEEYLSLEVDNAEIISHHGHRATLRFTRKDITASELIGKLSAKYRLRDIQVREPDIEDTIRRIYEKNLLQ